MSSPSPFIHVIFLPVFHQGYDEDLSDALALLDEKEKARYALFRLEKTKQSYLQTRRIIKTALVDYGVPHPVQFQYSQGGKPSIDAPIHFSLSHCDNGVAVAISSEPIGIDIETTDRGERIWRNAESFISPHAKAAVDKQTSPSAAADMFTLYWTCVEALVKLNDSSIYQERSRIGFGELTLDAHWQRIDHAKHHYWTGRCGNAVRVSLVSEVLVEPETFVWEGGWPARKIDQLSSAL